MKITYSLLLISLALISCQPKDAATIHREALVIDTHTDTPMQLIHNGFDLGVRNSPPDSRVDYPRLREGQVDGIFFALFTSQRERTAEKYDQAYRLVHQMIDSTLMSLDKSSELAELAVTSDDVSRISASQKTAIYFGMENGFPLAKDLSRVEEFYQLGVRYITLCHSQNNDLCDSSTDPKGPEHDGVSDFGAEVIAEMNRLGMMIDVSHISDAAFYDVLALSKAPVIASHSSVRALCDHPRNLTDDMIKALAQNGGVIQICILGNYIRPADTTSVNYIKHQELRQKYNNFQYASEEERKAAWAEWDAIERDFPPVLPSITDAVDHIDHVVKLVGIDYVGIGSDFDGGGGLADCADVSDFPKITEELVRRGYSEEDIHKIWGGNFLRVFRAVEDL
ncbi:MAG: dipeptidase [Prolixibacteraceae bacterium]|nr:dipeptidase [Prolixibacteraceae bacterium]